MADETADALLSGQVALYAGAGVSMFRQSRLPGWVEMICALLEQIAGPAWRREFRFVTSRRIDKIEMKRSSVVLRAKLYLLRDRVGKAVRLEQRRT